MSSTFKSPAQAKAMKAIEMLKEAIIECIGSTELSNSEIANMLGAKFERGYVTWELLRHMLKRGEIVRTGTKYANIVAEEAEVVLPEPTIIEHTCPICLAVKVCTEIQHDDRLQEFHETLECVMTPCRHRFCGPCLHEWTRSNRTCPLCQDPIPIYQSETVLCAGELSKMNELLKPN